MPIRMNFTLTQIGSSACTFLASGQRGKVLAAFSKAIYLLTETDELFWITTVDSPMHRCCAQITPSFDRLRTAPLPGLLAGSPFHVQGHRLMIAPDFVFEIDHALIWNAPHLNSVIDIAELPSRIYSLFSCLDLFQAKGFGNFIPQILSSFTINFTDPILRHAQPLVLDMVRACLDHQPSRIPSIANKLIGLGTGLTPSGDDFLGGMFFAIHQLLAAYPDNGFSDYAIPLEPYRSRTHVISYTLLADLAHGYAVAPLHQFINGLLRGDSFEEIAPSVSQLTSIGHSTGWDLLAGLLVGLLAADPNHYQKDCFVGKYALLTMTKA